jgi:hypothetical protein
MTTPQPLLEAMHGHLAKDEPRELGNVILLTKCVADAHSVSAVTSILHCVRRATPCGLWGEGQGCEQPVAAGWNCFQSCVGCGHQRTYRSAQPVELLKRTILMNCCVRALTSGSW